MAQVVALLTYLIGKVTQLIGIANTIQSTLTTITNFLGITQGGPTLDDVLAEISSVNTRLDNSTYGLNALLTEMETNQAGLLLVIGTPQQTGSPVTLPDPPPAGYGGASASDVVSALFGATPSGNAMTTEEILQRLGNLIINYFTGNTICVPIQQSALMLATGNLTNTPFENPSKTWLEDLTTLFDFDHWVDWFGSVNPTFPIVATLESGAFMFSDDAQPDALFFCPHTDLELALMKEIGGVSTVGMAPVWQGIAHETLGDSVALVDGLVLEGPMDGVLVEITSVPTRFGSFDFGPAPSYLHLGALAFVNDEGHIEAPQNLGFNTATYTAKTMVSAEVCLFRVAKDVVGSVRTFKRT